MTAAQDSRAQFEANIKALPNYFEGRLARTAHDDGYKVLDVHNQWIGWKASRSALSAEPVAVPKGWTLGQLITEEMHVAAVKVLRRASGLDGTPQRMLDAMLAAAPQPAAQERKPLTDAYIEVLLTTWPEDSIAFFDFARAIERAHGITGE